MEVQAGTFNPADFSWQGLTMTPAAAAFIDGTELDYVREGLNEIFKFHNPKAQHECGCGESFGVQAE